MNFKYIVAGAPSARAAGSAASVLILELRGDLTVESLFTSAHTCRPDGTHARTHTHSLCVTFPLLSLWKARLNPLNGRATNGLFVVGRIHVFHFGGVNRLRENHLRMFRWDLVSDWITWAK